MAADDEHRFAFREQLRARFADNPRHLVVGSNPRERIDLGRKRFAGDFLNQMRVVQYRDKRKPNCQPANQPRVDATLAQPQARIPVAHHQTEKRQY